MILITWALDGFWAIMELCLHDAHALAETQEIFFYPEITLQLAVSTLVGYVFRERIDPMIAIVAFELGWYYRLSIATAWSPSVLTYIRAYAETDHRLAIVSVSETVSAYSPLRLWTTHALTSKSVKLVGSCLFSVFSTIVLVLVYVLLRKVYHKYYPDQLRIVREGESTFTSRKFTRTGRHESIAPLYKSSLTVFELATGAALESRFGVVSDFDNYLIIKGMKYASSDGIYCHGFVILNNKVLVAAADLSTIVLMKLLRVQFRSVYTYKIDGSTVMRTAHLVYPDTFTWRDLVHLNINVLS